LLAAQLIALVVTALLVGIPGWAMGRLLELQLAFPTVMLPAAWFTLGLALWSVALVPCLALGWPWQITLALYAGAGAVLVVWSRLRDRRRGQAKPADEVMSPWTMAGIALAFLLAAAFRTRLAFDTLFHLGLVRRLLELPHPTFGSLDRIAGAGINPAYWSPHGNR
jgi:hypothetical protein